MIGTALVTLVVVLLLLPTALAIVAAVLAAAAAVSAATLSVDAAAPLLRASTLSAALGAACAAHAVTIAIKVSVDSATSSFERKPELIVRIRAAFEIVDDNLAANVIVVGGGVRGAAGAAVVVDRVGGIALRYLIVLPSVIVASATASASTIAAVVARFFDVHSAVGVSRRAARNRVSVVDRVDESDARCLTHRRRPILHGGVVVETAFLDNVVVEIALIRLGCLEMRLATGGRR
jgi:hypothetical protein